MKTWFVISFVLLQTMLAIAQEQYSIPNCERSSKIRTIGDRLRIQIPKVSTVRNGKDADYIESYIRFGEKKRNEYLHWISGPNATGGRVSPLWISDSKNTVHRVWVSGAFQGTDSTGQSEEGTFWRYFGMYGESISYHNVSKEAADFFDRTISSVCLVNS